MGMYRNFYELTIEGRTAALAALLERLAASRCRSLNDVALDMETSRQVAWDRIMADAGLPTCRVPDECLIGSHDMQTPICLWAPFPVCQNELNQ